MANLTANDVGRWREDPVAFIEEALRDPENNRPFVLYDEQKTFLRRAFELTAEGKMKYTELCFSAGKKSGKTGLAAMMVIYTAVLLAPRGGEIYCLANDLEQSQSRVFKAVAEILKVSALRDSVDITASRIVFRPTGTTIAALANDYQGFSGANPVLNCYDESAYYTSEGSRRLWDEGVPSPARKISFRLSVSTAGFADEAGPLRDLYDRAMADGTQIAPDLYVHENMLLYWAHECRAPWQSQQWIQEMERTYASRPAQFKRLIRNEWVASESTFIDLDLWDKCTDPELRPLLAKSGMPIWAALDLGLRHDSTALIACAWDGDRVRLVNHQVFTARAGETLDVESTAEAAIQSLRSRFSLQALYYDPWQAIGLAERLVRAGIKAIEYPQTLPNLGLMANNLIDLLRTQTLLLYPDADLRTAAAKTIAIESSRGMRLGKAKQSDRVDPIIALAMAALAAVQAGSGAGRVDHAFMRRAADYFHNAEMLRTGQMPRRGSIAEQDRAEDFANDMKRSSNPLRIIKSHRWGGRRGGY